MTVTRLFCEIEGCIRYAKYVQKIYGSNAPFLLCGKHGRKVKKQLERVSLEKLTKRESR